MTPSQRIYYLDTLRGFLMSMGVFIHSGIIVSNLTLPSVIGFLSSIFRMKLFFLVSGYFTAMVASKQTGRTLVTSRLQRVIVPALFAFIALNPITNYLIYITRVEFVSPEVFFSPSFIYSKDAPGYLNTHLHIWFLFALAIYFILLPILLPIASWLASNKLVDYVVKLKPTFALFVVGCIMTLAWVFARSAHYIIFQRYLKGTDINYPVQGTLGYLPYFIIGLVCFLNPRLFALLHRVNIMHAAVAAVVLGASAVFYNSLLSIGGLPLAEMGGHIGQGFAGFFLSCVLLGIFAAVFEHKSIAGSVLARTSYTVFIMHFIVIGALQYVLTLNGFTGYYTFFTTIVITLAACISFHYLVVERSRIAAFLVNGRSLKRKKEPS